MKTENKTYHTPALGCMLGSANQILLKELETALKAAGLALTTTEYLVMRALYHQEGIQQCEIADMVGRDKAGICRCVAGLVKKGLIQTEPVSYKCLRVYLSDSGRAIRESVMKVAESRHQALVDLVSSEELEVFNKVLQTIIDTKTK
ncbi:MAG: MarR family transcriptional regulator [Muribaculaceae bacterium]|nr:MarR family transcriptional regulator [Muribaculaceae bacterium]MDE6559697.1 MarR family transcriptional regulator [Muribaculaceae bacterium]